jgi:hypothetical protein
MSEEAFKLDAKRRLEIIRVLNIRAETLEKAGYTAGAEGLPGEPEALPDAFWKRVERSYQAELREQGLIDDVTGEDCEALIEFINAWDDR